MLKVLVTGGSGFMGSHICRELHGRGHRVLCLDDLSGSQLSNVEDMVDFENFIFSCLDLRNERMVAEKFENFRPDIVYHLAANARESASFFQPQSVISRNLQAYTNVLTNAIKYGTRRLVLFSSIATYGHQNPPFTEYMKLNPVDIYGLAKKAMEDMTRMLSESHGIEYVIFRPHNCFGEGQSLSDPFRNVIAIWMNRIMRGEPLVIYGDGEQQRAFSYISNSLPCYIKAMETQSGGIFNIGSDKPWTINTMAQVVKDAMGVPADYPTEYLPTRHGEVKLAYSDHRKAKAVLGFREGIDTVKGVDRMAKWAREQGPQEWRTGDELEIPNKLTPVSWK